jgi:hypothetical protein
MTRRRITHAYIDRTQYTILVSVVILSAVGPTHFAQGLLRPRIELGDAGSIAGADLPLYDDEAREQEDAREVAGALDE